MWKLQLEFGMLAREEGFRVYKQCTFYICINAMHATMLLCSYCMSPPGFLSPVLSVCQLA